MTIHDVLIRMRLSGKPQHMALAASMRGFRHVMTDRIPTAATDGLVFLWNAKFLATLSYDQLVGLVAHEWLHLRLRHSERLEASCYDDHRISNMAMDDEINSLLESHGYTLPPDGCHPRQINMPEGKTWEVYYPARLAEAASKDDDEPGDDQSGDNAGQPDGQSGDGQSGDGESGNGESDGNGAPSDGDSDGDGEQKADGCYATGELAKEFAPDIDADGDEAKDRARANATIARSAMRGSQLDDDAEQLVGGGSGAGSTAADDNEDGLIPATRKGELISPSNGERWQDVVIDTFRPGSRSSTDWGSRSRRLGPDAAHWLPGQRKIGGMHLALVVDVSGSCWDWFETWSELATELVDEIADVKRLTIIYHDTRVMGEVDWSRGEGEIELDCPMGGGTDHVEACETVADLDVDGVVYLTDCETRRWSDVASHLPTVTVLPGQNCSSCRCPWGVNVFADE